MTKLGGGAIGKGISGKKENQREVKRKVRIKMKGKYSLSRLG